MNGRVITVAQQKGGSGKTTLAAHLAVWFAREGRRVALLDTDPQGSLGRWFMARREATGGAPGLEFGTASAWGVGYEAEKLKKTADLVIIDTPPKIDADLRPALREADLVLLPVSVSHMDLWATEGLLELAGRERRPVMAVLNRVPPRARLTNEVLAAIDEVGIGRTEAAIGNRVAYAEALGSGVAAFELPRGRGTADEIGALAREIATTIGF
ncbi:chromosome partitioning protein [Meinhardsimonia xiamenensis]|jgi:chromosome partitioning protein|uniref:Chromosome partitioning protein n=1 Tax=Meinhardsimonia xiamenensis TaxID=990712 RepID=A0A1G8YEQ4_9RHOB|nr:ParA family partition ATPase [Meinhardsimonia xiamenensis]PRX37272.1 chromosome partitioning protein [Meinhardsimonia xiamenensis]SDK01191.1 chromosome partitioning protein [Meinhardsimonia xiamenensis]